MTKTSKKSLLPKRIAGVKVPKSVRKGRIGEAIASSTGQAVLCEVIRAAAASARESNDGKEPLVDVADRLRQVGEGKSGKAADDTSDAVVYAMGEAARTFVDALNRRRASEAEAAPEAQSAEGLTAALEPRDSKKKPPPREGATH